VHGKPGPFDGQRPAASVVSGQYVPRRAMHEARRQTAGDGSQAQRGSGRPRIVCWRFRDTRGVQEDRVHPGLPARAWCHQANGGRDSLISSSSWAPPRPPAAVRRYAETSIAGAWRERGHKE